MTKISFVYFDVGGVVLKDLSDTDKWEQILAKLGLDHFDKEEVEDIYRAHDNDICVGNMHVDELLPFYSEHFDITIPANYSLQKEVIDNFDTNPPIWPIIEACQQKYRIGILSDQWPDMFPELVNRRLLPPFNWNPIILSTIEKIRKPMPEIYQLAQQKAGVPPQEILFIDNREKNLAPARDLGWQTFLYDSSNYDQASADLAKFLGL